MIRVVLTGPESSGKTVLAEQLANKFNTVWVQEYLRTYFDAKKAIFEENMPEIAQKQLEIAQNRSKIAKNVVFLDTNILTLKIYHELYFKSKPSWFEGLYKPELYNHYLLLRPDIPWVDDGQRDMPERRAEIFELFKEELELQQANYTAISGSFQNRFRSCVETVTELLEK